MFFSFSRHSQLTDAEVEEMRLQIRALIPVSQDRPAPSLVDLFSMMSEADCLTLRHFDSAHQAPGRPAPDSTYQGHRKAS